MSPAAGTITAAGPAASPATGTLAAARPTLTTSEFGTTDTFTVKLDSRPSANVTIGVLSSNIAEATVSTSSLIFTSATWNILQTVTVTGVDDHVVDGDTAFSVKLGNTLGEPVSLDPAYSGLTLAPVAGVNQDNDGPAYFIFSSTGGMTTSQDGLTIAQFTIQLNTAPTANVTLGLSSSDTTQGTVSPASLVFSPGNWNNPQAVTVSGVDDNLLHGPTAYKVLTGPVTGGDSRFTNPVDLSVTNLDNHVANVPVSPTTGLVTSEGGTVTGITRSGTTATVTLPGHGFANGALVAISGADQPDYNGIFNITVVDANTFAYTVPASAATPATGTISAQGAAIFRMVLSNPCTANVTIGLSSSDPTEGMATVPSVVFTPSNWNVIQTVTVTGVDDFTADGAVSYSVITAPAGSADPNWNGVAVADVAATNLDNNAAGVVVSPSLGLVTSEAGTTATFTIVLTSQPLGTYVNIGLISDDEREGTISTSLVRFDQYNWNVPQTVTVTGVGRRRGRRRSALLHPHQRHGQRRRRLRRPGGP